MLSTATGIVKTALYPADDVQELTVDVHGESRRALNYVDLAGHVSVGDTVLLNTTAQTLKLGTGGYDYVISAVSRKDEMEGIASANDGDNPHDMPGTSPAPATARTSGHIIKARYTPCQHSVLTLEEQEEHASIWDRQLDGVPVLTGQLHSQMIPAAAGLREAGCKTVVYIMTDAAALPIAFSKAVRAAKSAALIDATVTCGQAFGGDHETVTLHSALLAAKHLLNADAVIVCQGPGNAGTGTKYGFSGIEQAGILDTVDALGGTPIVIVRMSEADKRERHQGISHHTLTSLHLVRSRCVVPLPTTAPTPLDEAAWGGLTSRHDVRHIDGADIIVDRLASTDLPLSTMGRSIDKDRVFFLAAAAAGLSVRGR